MIEEIGAHSSDGRPMLLVETREEWHAWLERNHGTSPGVWLVLWKKASGKPYVPYGDTVDEALCAGSTPGLTRSTTSEPCGSSPAGTPEPVVAHQQGKGRRRCKARMTEAGASMIAAAQSNGAWTVYGEDW